MKEKDEKIKSMRKFLDFEAASKEADRCLLCKDAPCSRDCPAGTDPAKFIRQIKFENYKGAARTIRNNNAFASVCSYVCPSDMLCEKSCTLKAIDDPVNIRGLQLFASLYGQENNLEPLECKAEKNGKKIAIIGGGPAGLGCAVELAMTGFSPVVFEKEDHLGGIAYFNVPSHRLADKALHYDLKNLSDLGVEIRYNTAISSNDEILKLLDQDFSAVFVAVGLSNPMKLDFLDGYSNVLDYSKLLSTTKLKKDGFNLKDKNVVVIGAGGSAMDVACSASIQGARRTHIVALESLTDFPANKEEVELAQEMNIIIKPSSKITGVKGENGVINSVEGYEVEWREPGNYDPANAQIVNGTEFYLNADYVIPAIGSRSDINISKSSSSSQDTIVANDNFSTNIPGVFVGGDVLGGASIAKAVGDGKKAAGSIIEFIGRV